MKELNNNEQEIPEIKIKGEGKAENPSEEVVESLQEAVEYGGGVVDPMEELAAEPDNKAVPVENEKDMKEQNNTKPQLELDELIDSDKIKTSPELSESDKPSFNDKEVQSALKDFDKEGGVVKNRSTGPTMSLAKKNPEGGALKPEPDVNKDSFMNKFEVTGFEVEYKSGSEIYSVAIRDYFDDIDTAFSSVNEGKYLMPIPNGYKIATIREGAPTISYNEREIYHYKDDRWVRT